MYDYSYNYNAYNTATSGVATGLGVAVIITWLISLGLGILTIVAMWKVFTKAGKPGWAAIVPIYNIIVMLEVAELPLWYLVLYFIPFANIYMAFKLPIEIAHKFGKTTGFGVGMAFFGPIFYSILAFGSAQYEGTVAYGYQQPTYQQPVQPQMQQPVQQTSTTFCPNCGAQNASGSGFCGNCGTRL